MHQHHQELKHHRHASGMVRLAAFLCAQTHDQIKFGILCMSAFALSTVSNLRRLGVTEVDLTNSLIAGIETLVKLEKMLALAEPPASTAAANLIGQIIDNESAMGLQ
eukprot:SAG31_NODE_2727_length_5181_cov_7.977568_3_plen_107_part_00